MKKFFFVLAVFFLFSHPGFSAETLTVTRVMDGDTLELDNGEIVRLLGIDCEENEYRVQEAAYLNIGKKWERSPDSLKRAQLSAEFTRKQVEGIQVRLEYDVQQKDKYGRTLAYVWFTPPLYDEVPEWLYLDRSKNMKEGDGFLNATLIKAGYAQVMINPPNVKYQELFVKLEKEAKENKRGLWKPLEKSARVCEKIWMEITPVQCRGNPWEKDKFLGLGDEFQQIKAYCKSDGVEVFDVQSKKKADAVCAACHCPKGYDLYLSVCAEDAKRMKSLGFRDSNFQA